MQDPHGSIPKRLGARQDGGLTLFAELGTCQTLLASPSLQNTTDLVGRRPQPAPPANPATNAGQLLMAAVWFGTWGCLGGCRGQHGPLNPRATVVPNYFLGVKGKAVFREESGSWEGGRPRRGGLGITPGMGALRGPTLTAFPGTSSLLQVCFSHPPFLPIHWHILGE